MDWMIANNLYPSGRNSYQVRDPKAHFILNDNFQPYSLSRRKAGQAATVPVSLDDKLSKMLSKAGYRGSTASSIRYSGIRCFGTQERTTMTLRTLQASKLKREFRCKDKTS